MTNLWWKIIKPNYNCCISNLKTNTHKFSWFFFEKKKKNFHMQIVASIWIFINIGLRKFFRFFSLELHRHDGWDCPKISFIFLFFRFHWWWLKLEHLFFGFSCVCVCVCAMNIDAINFQIGCPFGFSLLKFYFISIMMMEIRYFYPFFPQKYLNLIR